MQQNKIKVWRLKNNGHTVFGYKNITCHYTNTQDTSFLKFNKIIKQYNTKAKRILEIPKILIQTKKEIFYLQKRGDYFKKNNNKHIKEFIKTLKIFHSIPTVKISLFQNKFLIKNKYDTKKIWNHFYKKQIEKKFNTKTKKIEFLKNILICQSENILQKPACLIHGDLNLGNILFFGNKIKFIDWSDARIDNPYLDITQFIFNSCFSIKKSEGIIKLYEPRICLNDLFYFILLLILWIKIYMPNDKANNKIANHWIKKIKKFNFLSK